MFAKKNLGIRFRSQITTKDTPEVMLIIVSLLSVSMRTLEPLELLGEVGR